MRTASEYLFAAAVWGTLALPLVLAATAWRTPRGARARRLAAIAAAWFGFCVLGGVARFFNYDHYYDPVRISVWAESSSTQRRVALAMLAAVAAATAGLSLSVRCRVRAGAGATLIVAGWIADAIMLAYLVVLTLGH